MTRLGTELRPRALADERRPGMSFRLPARMGSVFPPATSGAARVGLVLCYLACFTIPWTAVKLGGLRVGDAFLLLAIIVLVLADLRRPMRHFPAWVWFFVVTIVVVGVIHEFFPVSAAYMANHETVSGIQIKRGNVVGGSNLSVLIRFLIAVVGLPLIFIRAEHFDRRAVGRSAVAFMAGSAISALISFTDTRGLTALSAAITGIPAGGGRGAGLTESPNYVALGCVFSLPFALWKLTSPDRRTRIWAGVAFVALLLGVYGSGSRSGAGAGLLAVVLSLVFIARYRSALPVVLLVLVLLAAVLFVVDPGTGHAVLTALRLTNDQGSGSDVARRVINDQAGRDFLRSPIDGIGLQVAGEAHIVYLQALAAGGIILLTGYLVFLLSALVRCLRLLPVNTLAAPLFVSIFAGAIFNAAQNALTLRIVFVPAALAAALPLTGAWLAARRTD